MKYGNTLKVALLSLIAGFVFLVEEFLFSGTSPLINSVINVLLIFILSYNCYRIIREPNRMNKFIQIVTICTILFLALLLIKKNQTHITNENHVKQYKLKE